MPFFRFSSLLQRVDAIYRVAIMALLLGMTIPAIAADSTDHSVIGLWKFKAARDFAEIASLDEREAQQLVGHTLTINREQVQVGKRVCLSPDFESERVEPSLYLRKHYHASASQLGLPNPVTVVHLNCMSAFVKNRDHLVVFWQGWFFDAVRVKR